MKNKYIFKAAHIKQVAGHVHLKTVLPIGTALSRWMDDIKMSREMWHEIVDFGSFPEAYQRPKLHICQNIYM